jgi:starch synthase
MHELLEGGIRWPTPQEGAFWERAARDAPLPVAPPTLLTSTRDAGQALHVVHLTAEMAPLAKVCVGECAWVWGGGWDAGTQRD